jgi:hypothetical protein
MRAHALKAASVRCRGCSRGSTRVTEAATLPCVLFRVLPERERTIELKRVIALTKPLVF